MNHLLLSLALLALPLVAGATTRYVAPDGTDAGDCSDPKTPCATIAYAVGQSIDGDLVSVAAGTYAAGATLDRDVTVEGAGQDQTAVTGAFTISAGVTATLHDLTVRAHIVNHGTAALERVTVTEATTSGIRNTGTMTLTDALVFDNDFGVSFWGLRGGGIHNTGTLTVLRTTVRDNDLSSYEAGSMGGGIYNEGSLTVVESLIMNNTAYDDEYDNGYGGGIYNQQGAVTIINSTLRGNGADSGGGLYDYDSEGTITISGSTFESNRSPIECGAISGAATLFNSTVSGNEGGLCGTMTLEFSTVAANERGNYYGIGALAGTFRLRNTIVAGNEADCSKGDDDWGGPYTLISYDYNVLGDLGGPDDCVLLGQLDHTLVGVEDPRLGPLADNGGPTRTHVPRYDSPALEAGVCTAIDGSTTTEDQRGEPRPRGAACDPGSVEGSGAPVTLTVTPPAPPVVLPPEGGTVAFAVRLASASDEAQVVQVWAVIANEGGLVRERGPLRVALTPGDVLSRPFTLPLPPRAPGGTYTVSAYAGTYPDGPVATGSFSFEKQASPFAVAATLLDPPDGELPLGGGPIAYSVTVTNQTATTRTGDFWGVLTQPDGVVDPYAGPVTRTLAPGAAFTYAGADTLAAADPGGTYTFAFFAGTYPDAGTAADGFAIQKGGVRYVATTGSDPGNPCTDPARPCATIRRALTVSGAGDVIEVAAGTYTEPGLRLEHDVTVRGAGADATVVQGAPSVAAAPDRVFLVAGGVTATLEGLTIRHGNAGTERGGGIRNYGGTLHVTRCSIRNNAAAGGGGISNERTLTYEATLTLAYSTVDGNVAEWGAGIDNNSTLTVIGSTLTSNEALSRGGGLRNTHFAHLTNSTVSGNTAVWDGGGIYHWTIVGALTTRITHSTITGNTADADGDGRGHGGGLFLDTPGLDKVVEVRGSILAGNTDLSGAGPDCYSVPFAELVSGDYNVIEDTTGCTVAGTTDHDLYGVDPMLGPLDDHGGPTLTHALLDGSPAVDAGICTDLDGNAVAVDQRGAPRPFGPACDIGAFEFGAVPPLRLASSGSVRDEAAERASAQASADVPATYALLPAYPNPLARAASLRYGLPEAAHVRLVVYDVLGRQVAILVDAEREAGWHAAHLDASGLAAGSYFYTLTAGDFRATRRLTVVR